MAPCAAEGALQAGHTAQAPDASYVPGGHGTHPPPPASCTAPGAHAQPNPSRYVVHGAVHSTGLHMSFTLVAPGRHTEHEVAPCAAEGALQAGHTAHTPCDRKVPAGQGTQRSPIKSSTAPGAHTQRVPLESGTVHSSGQAAHAVAPALGWYGHISQAVWPLEVAAVPGRHARQPTPDGEWVPGAHALQPPSRGYAPGAHTSHAVPSLVA